jgi:hypothetical protein
MVIWSPHVRVRWACLLVGSILAIVVITIAWNLYLLPTYITPAFAIGVIILALGGYGRQEFLARARPTAALVVTVVAIIYGLIALSLHAYGQMVGPKLAAEVMKFYFGL